MPGALADDVELALQRVGNGDAGATADKYLPHHRLDQAHGFAEVGVVHRHIAPAEQHLALVFDRALNFVFARETRSRIARQEHHPDPVLAHGRQPHALFAEFLAEKPVRYLDQDTRAVGGLGIRAHRAAVIEVFQGS